jgi:hypothetical protein
LTTNRIVAWILLCCYGGAGLSLFVIDSAHLLHHLVMSTMDLHSDHYSHYGIASGNGHIHPEGHTHRHSHGRFLDDAFEKRSQPEKKQTAAQAIVYFYRVFSAAGLETGHHLFYQEPKSSFSPDSNNLADQTSIKPPLPPPKKSAPQVRS